MADAAELSEAKRALLEKYLKGNVIPTPLPVQPVLPHLPETPRPKMVEIDERAPIVSVQKGGSKRPFFFLHGDWTDNAFFCFPLARDLGAEQPFYVLEPYKFEGLETPPTTEVMAAAHIKAIRSIQPHGPYMLGGFCNGGLIAYEMARQLHAQGEKTDLLVLMDSIPARLASWRKAIHRIGTYTHLNTSKELDWFLRIRHSYKFMQLSAERRSEDMQHLKKIDAKLGKITAPTPLLRLDYPGMFTWATASYEPGYYPGKVTLFWDEAEPFRKAWWDIMAKGKDAEVEEHIIPGTHLSCRTDHLPGMAQHLRDCIEKIKM